MDEKTNFSAGRQSRGNLIAVGSVMSAPHAQMKAYFSTTKKGPGGDRKHQQIVESLETDI